MFKSVPAAAAVMMSASVAACGLPGATASPEREAEARALMEDLIADRDDVLVGKMSTQVNPADARAQLPFMKTLVPDGPLPAGTVAGWRANASTGGSTYEVAQTYQYPDRTLTVSTMFRKEGDVWKVLGFHIAPTMMAEPPIQVVQPAQEAGMAKGAQ